ncbi:MAG: sugar kinase [Chloroflexi bacterium]|nr:sugar kinase [Chloroflexota bacterium]
MVPEVVTFGETMVLLAANEIGPLRFASTFTRFVAGTESNVAIGLARLGHSVAWSSRVGDDEFGQLVINTVRGEGVDTRGVIVDAAAPTGLVLKEKREVGPRKVLYYRAGSAASRLAPSDLDAHQIGSARWLHVTGVTMAISSSARETVRAAVEMARDRDVKVSFDPNMRLRLWTREQARAAMCEILPYCDVVLPGIDEAEMLTGESDARRAANALRSLGAASAVVKLGADGALAVTAHEQVQVPGIRLERIVDPVGAGDGFAAGFLSGTLRGLGLAESVRWGNIVGGLAMTATGDTEGLPTRREVEELRLDQDVAR